MDGFHLVCIILSRREVEVRRLPVLDANLRDVSLRYAAAVEVITEKEMQVRFPLSHWKYMPSPSMFTFAIRPIRICIFRAYSAARTHFGPRGLARHAQGADG